MVEVLLGLVLVLLVLLLNRELLVLGRNLNLVSPVARLGFRESLARVISTVVQGIAKRVTVGVGVEGSLALLVLVLQGAVRVVI